MMVPGLNDLMVTACTLLPTVTVSVTICAALVLLSGMLPWPMKPHTGSYRSQFRHSREMERQQAQFIEAVDTVVFQDDASIISENKPARRFSPES